MSVESTTSAQMLREREWTELTNRWRGAGLKAACQGGVDIGIARVLFAAVEFSSTPARPAATHGAKPRYGLASAPGMRFVDPERVAPPQPRGNPPCDYPAPACVSEPSSRAGVPVVAVDRRSKEQT